jgi:hypothetical protein
MDPKEKADAFVGELRTVIEKHYGTLAPDELEPFGMRIRQVLPMVTSDAAAAGSVTTTATVSLPADTDPPDNDD